MLLLIIIWEEAMWIPISLATVMVGRDSCNVLVWDRTPAQPTNISLECFCTCTIEPAVRRFSHLSNLACLIHHLVHWAAKRVLCASVFFKKKLAQESWGRAWSLLTNWCCVPRRWGGNAGHCGCRLPHEVVCFLRDSLATSKTLKDRARLTDLADWIVKLTK
jgi:hypothetical protein